MAQPQLQRYRCLAHTIFDAYEAKCPHGCTTVIAQEMPKDDRARAPGVISGKTKGTDTSLRRLADRFGYTDMSNKNGSVAQSQKMRSASEWKGIGKDQNVAQALKAFGVKEVTNREGEQSFSEIQKSIPKLRPVVTGQFGNSSDLVSAVAKIT